MKHKVLLLLGSSYMLVLLGACHPDPVKESTSKTEFQTVPIAVNIQPGIINEASGLAASINLRDYLWTIQDSGQPNSLYLVSKDGITIKQYNLPGTSNHDWEDIAAGKGPKESVNYIYVADIGNNNMPMTATNTIYRVAEIKNIDAVFASDNIEKITYKYPDGPRDAETLMLDPKTLDLYVISKEASSCGIYKLPFPQSTSSIITAEKLGVIPNVALVTGGDISMAGDEILIRTYLNVLHWRFATGKSIGEVLLTQNPKKYLIPAEPQGEAVAFDQNSEGYFTLSELGSASSVTLNYFKRK